MAFNSIVDSKKNFIFIPDSYDILSIKFSVFYWKYEHNAPLSSSNIFGTFNYWLELVLHHTCTEHVLAQQNSLFNICHSSVDSYRIRHQIIVVVCVVPKINLGLWSEWKFFMLFTFPLSLHMKIHWMNSRLLCVVMK